MPSQPVWPYLRAGNQISRQVTWCFLPSQPVWPYLRAGNQVSKQVTWCFLPNQPVWPYLRAGNQVSKQVTWCFLPNQPVWLAISGWKKILTFLALNLSPSWSPVGWFTLYQWRVEKGWLVMYLIFLPHIPALLMSLMQNIGHKMAAITAMFLRLLNVDF